MDEFTLFAGLAFFASFASAGLGVYCLLITYYRFKRIACASTISVSGTSAILARRGLRPFVPIARVILRQPVMAQYMAKLSLPLRCRFIIVRDEALCSCLVGFFLVCLVGGAVLGAPLMGAAIPIALLALASQVASHAIERREDALREALPDAVRSIGICLHAGLSQQQTFSRLEEESHGPLKEVFSRVSQALAAGSSLDEALALLKGDGSIRELTFVATALEIQHQAGGSMKQVLETAGEMLAHETNLRRSLAVNTAQARLSARVVVAVTVLLAGVLSVLSDGFLETFFSSTEGIIMLVVALSMQVGGIMAVRKILSRESF